MQRPGSVNLSNQAGQAPPYGTGGYQTVPPTTNSPWSPPTQTQGTQYQYGSQGAQTQQYGYGHQAPQAQQSVYGTQPAQQTYPPQPAQPIPPPYVNPAATPTPGNWGQPSQQGVGAGGGYNTGTYGAAPGYGQQPTQQQEQPPVPPPKPPGFAATVQAVQAQQQHQGGYPQQQQQPPGYPTQVPQQQQQSYNTPAAPAPQTPVASYFPPTSLPTQTPSTYTTPSSATPQQPPPAGVLTPNEQHPAYVPPSLSGQGVTSYMPANTNPMPGVYLPPPPDLPAWQHATHAPLQGGKKWRYTAMSNPGGYPGQGGQGMGMGMGVGQQQAPAMPQQQAYGQPVQNQFQQPGQPLQQQVGNSGLVQGQMQQPQQHQQQYAQQQPIQQMQQSAGQWQQTQPIDQLCGHQQPIQPPQGVQPQAWAQTPNPAPHHQHQHTPSISDIQAPKPLGHTSTTPPSFLNQSSPPSQPVSPIQSRQSMSFASGHNTRTGSVSSIAMEAIRNQHAQATAKPSSPAPSLREQQQKRPVAVPPPVSKPGPASAFSALGAGGPSDWEHFGAAGEEVDDEEMFGAKKEEKTGEAKEEKTSDAPPAADSFQPTPPLKASSPAQRPPSQPLQGFVMDEVVVASQSPKLSGISQPPVAQQSFVMDDGRRAPPEQPSQNISVQQPPSAQQSFVMDDGGFVPQQQSTELRSADMAQQQRNQQDEIDRLSAELRTSVQHLETFRTNAFGEKEVLQAEVERLKRELEAARSQTVSDRSEVEKLKSEAQSLKAELEALRTQATSEKAEIERLKAENEASKAHSASEMAVLNEQIQTMKTASDQAQSNATELAKENQNLVDRLKEDTEGKDDTIKERDATIEELKQELEAERAKEPPKPTPADLVPDIDPWYAGSLERYINMLRAEALEPLVENKFNIFTGFLRAESAARGLEYYSAPPAVSVVQQESVAAAVRKDSPPISRKGSSSSSRKHDMQISLPEQVVAEQDLGQYSPGGRPILPRTGTNFNVPASTEQNRPASTQSTTILTPASSVDDDANKTPIQSPPEEQPKPQYKAYVPPAASSSVPDLSHRQSMSFASPSSMVLPLHMKKPGQHDEIFFGEHQPASVSPPAQTSATRSTSSDSVVIEDAVPAPLSLKPRVSRDSSPAAPAGSSASNPKKKSPSAWQTLDSLIPPQITPLPPHPRLQSIRAHLDSLDNAFFYIESLTTEWEKDAAIIRKKNDEARLRRQEESEARTDQLFNDNEISYADIGAMEDEFKEKEREGKAREDREEYASYVKEVFEKAYEWLQGEIGGLVEAGWEVEELLKGAVSAVEAGFEKSVGDGETTPQVDVRAALELLIQLHAAISLRHQEVHALVLDRDRRYKKTELQPLYARGDIAKMKAMEKHFEAAERKAIARGKEEIARGMSEALGVVERVVRGVVGREGEKGEEVLALVREALVEEEATEEESDLGVERKSRILKRTSETFRALSDSSRDLMTVFFFLDVRTAQDCLKADIAVAKIEAATPSDKESEIANQILEMEERLAGLEKKMEEEFGNRVKVLREREGEGLSLVREVEMVVTEASKGGVRVENVAKGENNMGGIAVGPSGDSERERRMREALLEARRRNGEAV